MYESLLLKEMTNDQLEEAVSRKVEDFHGLLTREVALKLIAKEKGLLKEEEKSYKIRDIPRGARKINFTAKILRILSLNTYNSGKKSRGMLLTDETGKIELRLWEEDLEYFSKLKVGDEILVKNAYEKNGALALGYNGDIEMLKSAPFSPFGELKEGTHTNIRAMVSKIIGEKEQKEKSVKQNSHRDVGRVPPSSLAGECQRHHENFSNEPLYRAIAHGSELQRGRLFEKSDFAFFVSDGKEELRCVIRENASRGSRIQQNDEVIIQNALFKDGELHLGIDSRLLIKAANAIRGMVKEVNADDNVLEARIDERKLVMDRTNALKFLNIKVADDIKLSTLAYLKKSSLLNSNIQIKGKEMSGRFVIE